jgi:hypothetical protein
VIVGAVVLRCLPVGILRFEELPGRGERAECDRDWGRAYHDRKVATGKTPMEAMRAKARVTRDC